MANPVTAMSGGRAAPKRVAAGHGAAGQHPLL